MASSGVLCDDTDVKMKAGAGISSTIDSGDTAETDFFIDCAEGMLCVATRYDWVTNIAVVSAIGKDLLKDAASAYAAIMCINYDMSGYTDRAEAMTMVNILWAQYRETINMLTKDNKYKEFILSGAGDID